MPQQESATSFVGGSDLAVFRDSDSRDGAWKFVAWLSRPEVQVEWYEIVKDLPAVSAAWDDPVLCGDRHRAGEAVQGRHRASDGTVGVLLWNGTLDHAKLDGDPLLRRQVTVRVTGLASSAYELRHWRVDDTHSNVAHAARRVEPVAGTATVEVDLPMPAISYLELVSL